MYSEARMPMFSATLSIIDKKQKQHQGLSAGERIHKTGSIHIMKHHSIVNGSEVPTCAALGQTLSP